MPDGMPAETAAPHELATLFPAPRSATVAGRVIDIQRCTIEQGGRILDVGLPIWERFALSGDDPLTLFESNPGEAVALLHAATGLGTEWLASLDAVDKLDIATQWIQVNAAFFVQRLMPKLIRVRLALASAFGVGPTPSRTSLPPASPTPPA